MPDNIKIKRWLSTGEFNKGLSNTDEVISEAGFMLDCAGASEILGPAIFESRDGKFYGVFIEACIVPFNDEEEAKEWCQS